MSAFSQRFCCCSTLAATTLLTPLTPITAAGSQLIYKISDLMALSKYSENYVLFAPPTVERGTTADDETQPGSRAGGAAAITVRLPDGPHKGRRVWVRNRTEAEPSLFGGVFVGAPPALVNLLPLSVRSILGLGSPAGGYSSRPAARDPYNLYRGDPFMEDMAQQMQRQARSGGPHAGGVSISTFRWQAEAVVSVALRAAVAEQALSEGSGRVLVYSVQHHKGGRPSKWVYRAQHVARSLHTVVLPAGAASVVSEAKQFMSKQVRKWHKEHTLPHRRGILLHGAGRGVRRPPASPRCRLPSCACLPRTGPPARAPGGATPRRR